MKTFNSFVTTKQTLQEEISRNQKEMFKKILYCTLTQGRLTPNSENYQYFYREIEDNVSDIKFLDFDDFSLQNIEVFVEFFANSPLFRGVNVRLGKTPIVKSLSELESYLSNPKNKGEKATFITNYSQLFERIESIWKNYNTTSKADKDKDPNAGYLVPASDFVTSVLALLTATDSNSPEVMLFRPVALV